jgi:hypothetical protein
MLTYNTQQRHLILPAYGRNIQHMVEHCLTIEDRNERNACARAIIECMLNLFPEIKQKEGYEQRLWDHLAIMSDFQLDVDYPYEVIQPDSLESRPQPVFYPANGISSRHYGHNLEAMIETAAHMEPGEERDALIILLANHMKKMLLAINPEGVDDAKVFKDLAHYSHGAIRLDPATHRLHQFQVAEVPTPTKKKKKKK